MSSPILARRYDTLRPVSLSLLGDKISQIVPAPQASLAAELALPIIAPGFVDLQINGFGGIELNDPNLTPEQVRTVSLAFDQFGVTRYLPTCTTDSFYLLEHSFRAIGVAYHQFAEVRQRVAGIHLEGPFICPADGPRGAHPLAHVRPPDWNEFVLLQRAAQGLIKLITLSPEYPEARDFIRQAVASGVVVSIGHTAANSEQISEAVAAGATMSTHLGNGAHSQIRRHPNYIWDQIADDRLTASLIADGHHLPPAVLTTILRAKGSNRCVLVSDITGLAGMPVGRHKSGLGEVEILENGKLVVAGQRELLAGASQPISVNIAHLLGLPNISLQTAIEMASLQPAAIIGDPCGGLNVGAAANLVVFSAPQTGGQDLDILATIQQGKVVFGKLS